MRAKFPKFYCKDDRENKWSTESPDEQKHGLPIPAVFGRHKVKTLRYFLLNFFYSLPRRRKLWVHRSQMPCARVSCTITSTISPTLGHVSYKVVFGYYHWTYKISNALYFHWQSQWNIQNYTPKYWSDSTVDKTLALHITDPGLIPGTPVVPQSPIRSNPWTQSQK